MTRINLVPVKYLYDQHLLAEHRELKRIPNQIRSWSLKPIPSKIPSSFCLWTWHVLFFTNKLLFLKERYVELRDECRSRGFDVSDYIDSFSNLPTELFNPYSPSEKEIALSKSRIDSRYRTNFYRYKWVII